MPPVTRKRLLTNGSSTDDTKKKKGKTNSKKSVKISKTRKIKKEPSIVPIPVENGPIFTGYDKELAYLDQLVLSLLSDNKANSVIVCGDAGYGKNKLVENCLNKYPVLKEMPDSEFGKLNVVLFEFDGNLHGKNDLATLRLIGRRLNLLLEKSRQVALEDESEIELDDGELSNKVAKSIPKIIAQFQYLIKHSPIFRCIIILDNFEVFTYRQQYLLYNLFDLIQQGDSVLIIGLTRRLDCIQLLTSRVQSRLNRRMIHLVAPFKTLEEYTKFCLAYFEEVTKENGQNYQNMDKNQFLSDIEKTYSINHSFDEVKRLIHEHSFVSIKKGDNIVDDGSKGNSSIVLRHDPKVVELTNLTRNELVLLIVTTRHLRNMDKDTFTCKQLYEWANQIQQLKSLKQGHIFKCINKMVELDLLIIAKESRSQSNKNQLWITPWTTLMPNISEFQLTQLIEQVGNKMPAYIKQLLN